MRRAGRSLAPRRLAIAHSAGYGSKTASLKQIRVLNYIFNP